MPLETGGQIGDISRDKGNGLAGELDGQTSEGVSRLSNQMEWNVISILLVATTKFVVAFY